tara:strand:- start:733 stop:1500 length:768 start_codon:yes stop_codon:yes gene_type:complete
MKSLIAIILFFLTISGQAQNQSDDIIPLKDLKDKPVFKGCTEEEDFNCSQRSFANYVQQNFDKEILSDSIDETVINFRFILGPEGKLKWFSVKAEEDAFKNEAIRILENLPEYKPGTKDGVPVNVLMRYAVKVTNITDIPGIKVVDTPPLNEDCLKAKDKKTCFSKWLSTYVNSNFDLDGVRKHLKRKVTYRSMVDFVIDDNGKVTNLKIDAPNKIIESELSRTMLSLPILTPAEIDNRAIAISYKLPVVFYFAK